MSAGTITLTNGSTAVTGVGTTFTTDLSVGDIVTATVGGTFYTLYVAARASNTALTLSDPFPGATTSGLSWVAVPSATLNRVAASMVTQTALAVRRILQENANWQAFYQGTGDIVVTLDDGTPNGRQITGPSWAKIKADGGSAWLDRGEIPANTNITSWNPATTEGTWSISNLATVTVANGFPPGAQRGVLTVVAGGYYSGTRIYSDQTGGRWSQTLTAAWNGSGPWSDWVNTSTKVLRTTTLSAKQSLDTINGRDVDGTYRFTITTATVVANGVPYDGFRGYIICQQGVAESDRSSQTATSTYGLVFTRYVTGVWTGAGPWSPWLNTGFQTAPNFYTGNADDLLDDGDYPTSSATTGLPDPALWGASTPANNGRLSVRTLRSNTSVTQEFTLYSSTVAMNGRKWHREKYSTSAWTPWVENIDEKSLSRLYGIGGTVNTVLSALDWQQFDFVTGATYLISNNSMTNTPAGISTYPAGTGLFIKVVGISTSGTRPSLEITPDVSVDANYRRYNTIVNGAKGSRTFFTRQVWTSTDVGTTAGTVAAGNDSRLNTVGGKTGGDVSGTLRLTAASPASTPAANTLTNGLQAKSMFINGVYTNIAFGFYPQVIQGQGTRGILQLEIPTLTYWSFEQDGRALSSGGWQTGSDIVLKENVQNVPKALASVLSMDGVTWDYRLKKGQAHRTPGVGLIAQQVERFCPKGVSSFPGNVEFDDESTASDVKSLDVSGVSAAYHNEAIKALFGLVKLALDDPDAARAQIAAIEADAQELAVSLDDLQRDYVPTPPQDKLAEDATENAEAVGVGEVVTVSAGGSQEVESDQPSTSADQENQPDTQQ